jgi:hypothetical protein
VGGACVMVPDPNIVAVEVSPEIADVVLWRQAG